MGVLVQGGYFKRRLEQLLDSETEYLFFVDGEQVDQVKGASFSSTPKTSREWRDHNLLGG